MNPCQVQPSDFGVSPHPLSEVQHDVVPGNSPEMWAFSTNSSAVLRMGQDSNGSQRQWMFCFLGHGPERPFFLRYFAIHQDGPSFILAGGWQQPRGECHRDARALAGKVPKLRKLVKCSSGAEPFLCMDQNTWVQKLDGGLV